MTDYPFTGNETSSISFTPTLDGTVYNVEIKWNLASQRWYFTVSGTSGIAVLTAPLIGCMLSIPVNLLYGVFSSSTMVWIETDGIIRVVP